MTDLLIGSVTEDATVTASEIKAISAWLDLPISPKWSENLATLLKYLNTLKKLPATDQQRTILRERLYSRCISTVSHLLPELIDTSLPLHRKTRQLVRHQHDVLRVLSEELLAAARHLDSHVTDTRPELMGSLLWKSLFALTQHLLISYLTASPAGVGIWQQLHQIYKTARRLNLEKTVPPGTSYSLHRIYCAALLQGCAQPASFTSREVNFVAAYLERFANLIDLTEEIVNIGSTTFWVDPERDAPATATARKPPPASTTVLNFSCDTLTARLKNQLSELESGSSPQQISLPSFADSPSGRGVLARLVSYWSNPGKRRFPRRRQNYRATLCVGLHCLWHLFREGEASVEETSTWMIVNESPDGCAAMHVSGKMGEISVGDVAALKTETGENWQICIVRWAISENQEHLECGFQILATEAIAATLACMAKTHTSKHLPALILPGVLPIRRNELLVTPSGATDDHPIRLVLVIEKENIEIREVLAPRLDEQNSHIEVYSIEADAQ